MITPQVTKALEELRAQFGETVTYVETGDGGAHVTVDRITLGTPYQQADSWFAFTITYLHPYGDIYPLFVRPDLTRIDGRLLMAPLNPGNAFQGVPAVMVSRRTRLLGPAHPVSPVLKLLKVREWMLSL